MGAAMKYATADEISSLIAGQMVGCAECNGVSAPSVRPYVTDDCKCNWETYDWRGDVEAVIRCRVAMMDCIDVLEAFYVLAPVGVAPLWTSDRRKQVRVTKVEDNNENS
jgi:hypothetical protein